MSRRLANWASKLCGVLAGLTVATSLSLVNPQSVWADPGGTCTLGECDRQEGCGFLWLWTCKFVDYPNFPSTCECV
jgi:hypothetical protein